MEISSFVEEHILLPVANEQTVKASNLHSNLLKMVFYEGDPCNGMRNWSPSEKL